MRKIYIGADHGGFNLKTTVIDYLKSNNYEVIDVGCFSSDSCDYPVIAKELSHKILENNSKGILICGTGVGMSIAANRHVGIRASLCTDTYMAKMTRKHNDSNVLCLGERVIGKGLALDIVESWLKTEFEGGRHLNRINMI